MKIITTSLSLLALIGQVFVTYNNLSEIEYIIPTFEWRKGKTSTAMHHRRLGGGLRIYLKRPWFSSGENEKLSVILPGFDSKNDPKKTLTFKGSSLNTYLSTKNIHKPERR